MNSLITNIDKCFSDCLGVVNALGIFDPLDVPDSTDLILRSMAPATLMCLQIIFTRMIS